MEKSKNITPEKKLTEYGLKYAKRIFLLIIAIISYWQAYEYVSEKPNITIFLENTQKVKGIFKTKIAINNGSVSIDQKDIVRPISINFDKKIDSLKNIKSLVNPEFKVRGKSISLIFDLFNNSEQIKFYIYSKSRPIISDVDYRIKNIESIQFYDFQNKPKFTQRVIIWMIVLLLGILLFSDALIVITKDSGLGKLKSLIHNFPLSKKSKKDFIQEYLELYNEYDLRFKPPVAFMHGIVENTLKTYPLKTERDLSFIRNMLDFKTEFYTFYRFRTAFVIISPIIIIISLIAIILNFFYYDIYNLNQIISATTVNKIIITLIFIITVIIIIFPRSIMTLVFLKKKSDVKF